MVLQLIFSTINCPFSNCKQKSGSVTLDIEVKPPDLSEPGRGVLWVRVDLGIFNSIKTTRIPVAIVAGTNFHLKNKTTVARQQLFYIFFM